MVFHPVDPDCWPRGPQFEHYFIDVPCTYSMTGNLDITSLLLTVKEQGFRLYPVLIYGIARAVNARQEFRMSIDAQGRVGWSDTADPAYTVFHRDDNSFSSIWTEYCPDFQIFYSRCIADMAEYGDIHLLDAKPAGERKLFDISCIPWTSFTSFHLNLKNGYGHLAPIFTIGKYFSNGGRMLLPLALQVHHAVCDGYHTAGFFNDLQDWADTFCG